MYLKKIFTLTVATLMWLPITIVLAGGVEYRSPPPVYSGFYFEGNLGGAFRDWEQEGLVQTYLGFAQGGVQNGFGQFNNGKAGFVYGFDMGYQWTRLFSGELGWYYLSSMQYTIPDGYTVSPGNTMEFSNWLAYIALKFSYPLLYQGLYVVAKLGAGYLDLRLKNSFIPALALPNRGDFWAPLFAFGLQYYFNWVWSINVQYMFMPGFTRRPIDGMIQKVPSPHSNIVTLGIGYKFAI